MQTDLEKQIWHGFITICSILLAAILIAFFLARTLNKKLEADFHLFGQFFKHAANDAISIDINKVNFNELDQIATSANHVLAQKASAEDALKTTQNMLTEAQIMANVGHYLLDVQKGVWTHSPHLNSIFGIDDTFEKDVSGWLNIVHPDFRQAMSDYLTKNVIGRYQAFDMEYKIIHQATGRERWVHGLGDLKLDEQNRALEMFGTIQDITERRQIQDSLRLTQFAFDKAAIGIFHIASDGRILNVNEQAAKDLGYTREQLSRMTVFDINPSAEPTAFGPIWQVLCQNGHDTFEAVHRRRDGTTFPVEVISNLIEYHGEQFSISFTWDITERRQAEQKRKELETQLLQTQKMEAIGTLAGGIAHDFNNILSGILGYSQLARAHMKTPEKVFGHIEQIVKGAQRAADLTRQILTFSRQNEYEKHPFGIYLEIKEALKLLRSSIPSTIDIKVKLDSRKQVLTDPIKIHQVIMNLCTNAYHAMRKTGGVLTVSLTDVEICDPDVFKTCSPAPGSYLRLEVSDTGHGMDDTTRKKAFEPYFITKEKGDGTGLGLALVHAIVEEHDGFLTLDTRPGKGACFRLYFPVVREAEEQPGPRIEKKQGSLTGNERIMVVDDDGPVRESLKRCWVSTKFA